MRNILFLMIPILLAACVEQQQHAPMRAIGGDKNQGVMRLAVTFVPGSQQLNWSQAQSEANRRCMAWGFAGALPFDDISEFCSAPNYDGSCHEMTVSRTYQCSVM